MRKSKVKVDTGPHNEHKHGGHKYLISNTTRICWFCQQVILPEPNPRQMALDPPVQMEMQL